MDKGREAASSQRFSYFGSLAEGGGGDGACEEHKIYGLAVSWGRACRQKGCGLNTGEDAWVTKEKEVRNPNWPIGKTRQMRLGLTEDKPTTN